MARHTSSILLGATLLMLGAAGCPDGFDDPRCPAGTLREGNKCVAPPPDAGRRDSGQDATDGGRSDAAPDGSLPDAPKTDAPTGPIVVFDDDYRLGVTFADFGGSTNALSIDTSEKQAGTASLKIAVPASGYTGGAFVLPAPADLSSYDALTFWAKASEAKTLDKVGLGNTGQSTTLASEISGLALTTAWKKFVVPLPLASKLTAESGLFHFAEGDSSAYTIWLDEIRYEKLGSAVIGAAAPAIATATENLLVGDATTVAGTSVTFKIDGVDQVSTATAPYFTFTSTNPAVATVDAEGKVEAKAVGTTEITATLGSTPAAGRLTINVSAASGPATAAPTPSQVAANVISLFSDAYADVTVDTWSAVWDSADVVDENVSGNATKKYTSLVFAGVEFTSAPIDASGMTHFHLDAWTPNGSSLKIKLVDFGSDKTFGGGDDTEHELTFDATTSPALTTSTWISFDIPLSQFTGLTARGALAQLVLSSSNATVYVDNVYFWK